MDPTHAAISHRPLDHAVISVRDRMDEAEAIYRRMGFTLTPRSFHTAGSANHLMVFTHDYLELIGFPLPGQPVRPDLVDAPIGLDGLVLHAHDAAAIHADLAARGLPAGAPQPLSRALRLPGAMVDDTARFTTVRFPRGTVQGGRLYYCQHDTPHLVWHPPWMEHANGAVAIRGFTIVVRDPLDEVARYERILGGAASSRTSTRSSILLGHATLELLTADALSASIGDCMPDAREPGGSVRDAYMAMVTIRVRNLARLAGVLQSGRFRINRTDDRTIVVPAKQAMNCAIAFTTA